ncbi:MAG: acyl-CoA thioesterase domain-containing protein, partial [Solirubrobacterales bacterium]
MSDVFYEIDGEAFVPTGLTRGPWDPGSQHAGPPAALLGRAIEGLGAGDAARGQVGRITFEILRAVPLAPLTVATDVVRPGRRVELVDRSLIEAEGELMRSKELRIREVRV